MTDNEIIKVLQNELECVKRQYGNLCDNKRDCNHCDLALKEETVISAYVNALDLINRQKAEIERLNIRNKTLIDITKNYDWKFARAKSEAIKEFAHLVINRSRNEVIYTSDIPDLVKEMTEVNENEMPNMRK